MSGLLFTPYCGLIVRTEHRYFNADADPENTQMDVMDIVVLVSTWISGFFIVKFSPNSSVLRSGSWRTWNRFDGM